jgi:hypothetical protein
LCLPGFYNLLRRSRALGEAKAVMKEAEQIDGLATLVARFIPKGLFKAEEGTRERKFTAQVTFNAFLGQVMSRGSSCREAVRKVQAWYLASGQELPGSNDSAYCQARTRLDLGLLRNVFERLCGWFEGETKSVTGGAAAG